MAALMSEAATLEQSAPAVETQHAAPVTENASPEVERSPAVDITLARIANDFAEVARLEALHAESKGEKPTEKPAVVETVTPEEVAAQAAADLAAETEKVEEAAAIALEQSGEAPIVKDQMRPRLHDPEDIAIAMIAKSKNISLAKAAKEYEGQQVAKVEQQQEVVQQPAPDPTIIALEAEVEALRTQVRETKKADQLDDSLPDLEDKLLEVRGRLGEARATAKALADMRTISQQERAIESKAAFERQIESVKAETAKAFPDLANKKSPLVILCDAMAVEMQDPAHPDHEQLFKPSIIRFLAEKNAAILKIAPVGSPAPATRQPEKPVARPAAGARGSAPAPPTITAEQAIAELKARALQAIQGGHHTPGRTGGLSGTIIY
jgi:hypothetical protein